MFGCNGTIRNEIPSHEEGLKYKQKAVGYSYDSDATFVPTDITYLPGMLAAKVQFFATQQPAYLLAQASREDFR